MAEFDILYLPPDPAAAWSGLYLFQARF